MMRTANYGNKHFGKGEMMRVAEVHLADISRDDVYDFSFPQCPQRYGALEEKLPGLPLLIIDLARRVISGHDYLRLLQARGQKKAVVLEADMAPAAALILNFNLLNRFFGLNLHEKLFFVKKVSAFCPGVDIQRRADLGFTLNEELFQLLDSLLDISLRPLLASGQLGLKGSMKLLDFALADRRALRGLFEKVQFTESQQLQAIQLLQEIAFREKKPLATILASVNIGALLEGEMPQKKIVAALHRRRYPDWAVKVNEWRQWQKQMDASGRMVLTHDPFFEKEEIQISLTVKNRLEAEALLRKLDLFKPNPAGLRSRRQKG